MDAGQVLAFRLGRSGLAERTADGLARAAACPASDVSRDAALLALAARAEDVTREAYAEAVDAGDVVVAHAVRGAIHALAPGDHALFGRALIARDEEELRAQLGDRVDHPVADLQRVAAATTAALRSCGPLGKNELHEELRGRLPTALLPWCPGCGSHHVAPMLWRYATVKAGARLDAHRRYLLSTPGRAPAAREALRRFLYHYAPATPTDFAQWAGVAPSHARRLVAQLGAALTETPEGALVLREDRAALGAPPDAHGIRLLPPGDPYLQKVNRPLLAPDAALRRRLFRPVGSPGAVLRDGRLTGLWRATVRGSTLELAVEPLGRLSRRALEPEARRVARLRGAADATVTVAR